RFKEVNDTLGHESGDLLLQEVGARLRALLRESDTVARLGGDEFGIVAAGIGDEHAALALAEKLRRELSEPVSIEGLLLEVEPSIGIALFPEGDSVETLVRQADVAMYVAKESHTPIVYSPQHDHYSPERLALISDL